MILTFLLASVERNRRNTKRARKPYGWRQLGICLSGDIIALSNVTRLVARRAEVRLNRQNVYEPRTFKSIPALALHVNSSPVRCCRVIARCWTNHFWRCVELSRSWSVDLVSLGGHADTKAIMALIRLLYGRLSDVFW